MARRPFRVNLVVVFAVLAGLALIALMMCMRRKEGFAGDAPVETTEGGYKVVKDKTLGGVGLTAPNGSGHKLEGNKIIPKDANVNLGGYCRSICDSMADCKGFIAKREGADRGCWLRKSFTNEAMNTDSGKDMYRKQ